MKNIMKNILKAMALAYLVIEIVSNLDGAISFLNRIGIKITDMQIINIAKVISDIFHFFTPFLVIVCVYYIIILKEKIIALKKFRDEDSLDAQRFMSGTLKAMNTHLESIYNKMELKWEREKQNEVSNIYIESYAKSMEKSIEKYNKAFPECEPFKPYEANEYRRNIK